MTISSSKPTFAVLQAGARMHYAVPALLAQTHQLKAFYTDLHSNHSWLQWLNQEELPTPKSLKRLLGRKLPADIPRSLVRDQPFRTLTATLLNRLPGVYLDSEQAVLERARQEHFAQASALYTNFINNDLPVVRAAKAAGLFCIHELIISIDVGRVLLEERRKFPGIEPHGETKAVVEAGIQKDQEKWATVDRVLVPSQYCFDSCVALGGDPNKLWIVPYGVQEEWLKLPANPAPGRILFVGQVGLRKGNHYLAEATRLLKTRGFQGEVRVVGPWLVNVENSLFRGPKYLGQVPRSLIYKEFCQADVFVLPTLSESFGLVHLEALACGVPVITTPHCGSVVRDGVEGFIVPIRDAEALAERIERITNDRQLRAQMGQAARRRAQEFTWMHYRDRLQKALDPQNSDNAKTSLQQNEYKS
ncbi:glycosyltransferase family 4 protein [Nodosilinea sp. LEGE 06152]|uniref:glycosyltransferase family 4 protein n=1 Tax=Nodosilinea sp. LEGE 06152 TaxID=2777966 RepID=UPI001880DC27|nr:glycosyltransferase family 4 protein [Nodosilinea sp. LEGE 06152]MBE9158404.1 glycosyltransferase family 4 protein [Nodosilinea sp. LEGE 06152]